MVKKPIRDFELRNVSPDDYINQAKGLKLVKERQRHEKHFLNFGNPRISQWVKDANNEQKVLKHIDHSQKVSDQIQRGFNIATKWRNEDEERNEEEQ